MSFIHNPHASTPVFAINVSVRPSNTNNIIEMLSNSGIMWGDNDKVLYFVESRTQLRNTSTW